MWRRALRRSRWKPANNHARGASPLELGDCGAACRHEPDGLGSTASSLYDLRELRRFAEGFAPYRAGILRGPGRCGPEVPARRAAAEERRRFGRRDDRVGRKERPDHGFGAEWQGRLHEEADSEGPEPAAWARPG